VRGAERSDARAPPALARGLDELERQKPGLARTIARDETGRRVLSVAPQARAERILARVFAEDEFLSPFGLRSLSRRHRDQPFELEVNGATARVDYEPGESTTPMYGGNSNWRGPVWMPLNYLAIEALRTYPWPVEVEIPTGSGVRVPLGAAADDLAARLVSIFTLDESGRRPVSRPTGSSPTIRTCVT